MSQMELEQENSIVQQEVEDDKEDKPKKKENDERNDLVKWLSERNMLFADGDLQRFGVNTIGDLHFLREEDIDGMEGMKLVEKRKLWNVIQSEIALSSQSFTHLDSKSTWE